MAVGLGLLFGAVACVVIATSVAPQRDDLVGVVRDLAPYLAGGLLFEGGRRVWIALDKRSRQRRGAPSDGDRRK